MFKNEVSAFYRALMEVVIKRDDGYALPICFSLQQVKECLEGKESKFLELP